MTSRSYFGKMNSILGSVVPLAMFKRMEPKNSGVINLNGILIEKLYFKDIMRTRVGIRRHNSFASVLHSRQTT